MCSTFKTTSYCIPPSSSLCQQWFERGSKWCHAPCPFSKLRFTRLDTVSTSGPNPVPSVYLNVHHHVASRHHGAYLKQVRKRKSNIELQSRIQTVYNEDINYNTLMRLNRVRRGRRCPFPEHTIVGGLVQCCGLFPAVRTLWAQNFLPS